MNTAMKFALASLVLFLAAGTASASTASGPPNLELLDQQISESKAGIWLEAGVVYNDITIVGTADKKAIVAIAVSDDPDVYPIVAFGGNSVIRHAIILVPEWHNVQIQPGSNVLIEHVQIVGKGPESRSVGLSVLSTNARIGEDAESGANLTVRDVILAGHGTGIAVNTGENRPDRPGGTLDATDLYVTNNGTGISLEGEKVLPEFYGAATIRRAYIWDNLRWDLYVTGGMNVDIDDSWIPGIPFGRESVISLYDGSSFTITNTVTPETLVPWLFLNPGGGREQLRIVNDGPLGDIQYWPRVEPRIPQDFTDDGMVDMVDFRHLAVNFGQTVDQVRSGLVLDLDRSGAMDTEDMVRFAYAYAELSTDQPVETLLATPQLQDLATVMVREYRSVAVELSSDPRLGTFFQNYLDEFPTAVTKISDETPNEDSLGNNYPNPFNAETVIEYQIAEPAFVELVVINSIGQKVKTLVSRYQQPGTYRATWDGFGAGSQPAATGTYFSRIVAGDFVQVQTMTLLR